MGLPSASPTLLRRLQKERLASTDVIFINFADPEEKLAAMRKNRAKIKGFRLGLVSFGSLAQGVSEDRKKTLPTTQKLLRQK